MMSRKEEISQENRRARKWFIPIVIVSGVVGAILGILMVSLGTTGIQRAAGAMTQKVTMLAPYLLAAEAVIFNILAFAMYRKSRVLLREWDGEEEEITNQIDIKLNYALWALSLNQVISFLLFALGVDLRPEDMTGVRNELILAVVFMANVFISIWIQQKVVDLSKEMNPEKKGSVYDIRFQSKWMDSCDEAEKMQVYQAAYSAFKVTNIAFMIVWLFAFLAIEFAGTGVFACVMISILWGIHVSVYCFKTIQLSK